MGMPTTSHCDLLDSLKSETTLKNQTRKTAASHCTGDLQKQPSNKSLLGEGTYSAPAKN